eukprot:1114478-Pleurochrysis_carterae.AAC.4
MLVRFGAILVYMFHLLRQCALATSQLNGQRSRTFDLNHRALHVAAVDVKAVCWKLAFTSIAQCHLMYTCCGKALADGQKGRHTVQHIAIALHWSIRVAKRREYANTCVACVMRTLDMAAGPRMCGTELNTSIRPTSAS